jgi:hypothetical protein
MPLIEYESRGFGAIVPTGTRILDVTWDEILHSALTVGRPSMSEVLGHGPSSKFEATYRLSMVRMALERNGRRHLRRTEAFKTLDPTEKTHFSYSLGLVLCKLFAEKLLKTPWLLHLDVYRDQLQVVLRGRSRPDLIGQQRRTKAWRVFECKGRSSRLTAKDWTRAKGQAKRVVAVGGAAPDLRVATATFFTGDTLRFAWRDPPRGTNWEFEVPDEPGAWRAYYAPIVGLFLDRGEIPLNGEAVVFEDLDVKIAIHPKVATYLADERWSDAKEQADRLESVALEGYQLDGIRVVAGTSWDRSGRRGAVGY